MDPQETTHGRKPCYGDTDMKETTAIVLSNVRGGAGIVGGLTAKRSRGRRRPQHPARRESVNEEE